VLIGVFANLYREEEKQLRRQLRESIKEKIPKQTAEFSKTIGLFFFEADRGVPRAFRFRRDHRMCSCQRQRDLPL